jgi:hypothetical protein
MQKQVEKSHYRFSSYMHKRRWASIWHQLDEVIKLDPVRVLEVGPGPGLFKAAASAFGVNVETLDLDPELKPDHVASVLKMPFRDNEFDVVCAFQMLEHLPFDKSLEAFAEMVRVARSAVIISLPDAATRWPCSVYLPGVGLINFSLPKPRLRAPIHNFDGEHYWEINKAGYSLSNIKKSFCKNASVALVRTYQVPEVSYHRYFIFSKSSMTGG